MITINEEVEEVEDVGTAYVKDLLAQIEQVARKSNSVPKEFSWWGTPKVSPANSATSNSPPLCSSRQVCSSIPLATQYYLFVFSFFSLLQ
jgi:hypothetical protein